MNLPTLFLRFSLSISLMLASAHGQDDRRSSGTIGSRDNIEVRVFREDELTTRAQVSPAGTVTMPLIGSVKVAGLSTDEAARRIEAKLRDGYLVRPEVSVAITSRVRKTVTVLGQAQNPGVFRLDPNRQLTLVEAIGMAGGMTRIANAKKVSLKRRGRDEPILVNVREIAAGRSKDVPLVDGDIITIPESLF